VRVCARGFWEIKHEKDEKVSSEGKLQARTASAIRMQFPLARRPSTFRTQASDRHSQVKSLHKQQTPRDGSLSIVLRKPAVEDGT